MLLVESLSQDSQPKPKATKRTPAFEADPDLFVYNEDKAILYALAGKIFSFLKNLLP